MGNLTSLVDANGNGTTYAYDDLDRLVEEKDALGNATRYEYDKAGNIAKRIDANGRVTLYVYDAFDRMIEREYLDKGDVVDTITFAYDKNGNRTEVADRTGETSFTHDKAGRMTMVRYPDGGTIRYGYYANGARSFMETTRGRTLYTYDALGRLVAIKGPGEEGVTTFAYDAAGRRTQMVYPNGVITTYQYDPAGRLVSLNATKGQETLTFCAYAYDNAGNRVRMTDMIGTQEYFYDATYQLIKVIYPGNAAVEYRYDPVGNRVAMGTAEGNIAYTYDAANRMLTAGDEAFEYDKNGNLIAQTGKGGARGYVYDYENRLVEVRGGIDQEHGSPAIAQYGYDGLGRRVSKVVGERVTRYHYDFNECLFETDGVGVVTRSYVHGPGIDEILSVTSSPPQYVLADGLGSTIALTDTAGAVVQRFAYDAFGGQRTANSEQGTTHDLGLTTHYLYTGRQYDAESGLYYYRNRYYAPSHGQFISRDVFPINRFTPGTINRYAYVSNNPINYVDPMGWCRKKGESWGPDWLQNGVPKYGNYGGPSQTDPTYKKKPVDQMDRLFQLHDMYWDSGNEEAGDKWLYDELNNLPEDPREWDPPAPDPKAAAEYRNKAEFYFWVRSGFLKMLNK